jgi:hypothetical protein
MLQNLKRILVLTPDAIGSNYFQRSLTVYLNWHGHPTKNYHELGELTLDLRSLVQTLSTDRINSVARCSPYRSIEFGEDTENYLKFCKNFFTHIYVIDRCSFESVLSYCNTHQPNKTLSNVYGKYQYLENKNKKPYSIIKDNFIASLKYFEDFYVWVDKYFPEHKKIKHLDLISNPDKLFEQEFNISSNKELSLKDFNNFNTLRIRNADLTNYSTIELLKFIDIIDYIDLLINKNLLPHNKTIKFPFKKITLSEKIKDISNFTELLDIYNNYPSNHFEKINENQIKDRAIKEDSFWLKERYDNEL